MADHPDSFITVKQCAPCGQDFLCNPVEVTTCQCSQVSFTEAEKRYIEQLSFADCLCLDCLKALKALAAQDHYMPPAGH